MSQSDRSASQSLARQMREATFSQIGKLDSQPLSIEVPEFPQWPSEQRQLRLVQTESTTLVLTDGISDPFEDPAKDPDQEYNGFGMELFVEVAGLHNAEVMADSQPVQMLLQAIQMAVGHLEFRGMVEQFGTMALPMYHFGGLPPAYLNPEGGYGALLGTPSPQVPPSMKLNLESALLVSVKLIQADELAQATARHTSGAYREALVLEFQKKGTHAQTLFRP